MGRSNRLKIIKELIIDKKISSQDDLKKELLKIGHDVTQSTISRDLNQLRLTKVRNANGEEYYALENRFVKETVFDLNKFRLKFKESVLSVNIADNIIVIKTYPGEAQGTAALIDGMNFIEVLGTVAGDDTIICVLDNKINAQKILKLMKDQL